MGKLPDQFADPVDSLLYKFSHIFLPSFRYVGLTPNMITTIGNISGIISLYYLYNKQLLLFFFFSIFRYIFDCMDGEMARRYNMTSKFGDIYEHISDIIYFCCIMYFSLYIVKKKHYFIISVLLLSILYYLYWNCEGDYFNNDSIFYFDKHICKNKSKKYLPLLRFFGPGCGMVYFYIILYYFLNY